MEELYDLKYDLPETIEEAYKVLRANIQFCEVNRKINTLAITSYGPGEGKTTTSINLSISMAKMGINVLYVDADIRKPMPFKTLVSNNLKGLSNLLMGQVELGEVITKSNIEGFSFITCGVKPENPGELIASEAFGNFVNEVKNLYDMIIIDTPPLGSVIDCAIIAAKTDGAIIVIETNAVKYRNAIMIKEQLKKANVNIYGAVLNKIDKTDYKNYYGGYDYYGSKKKYAKKWFKIFKKFKKARFGDLHIKRGNEND